jgi:hypothetical protein
MGGDVACGWRWRLALVDELAQAHLAAAAFEDAPLALLTEVLTTEPVELMFGYRPFAAQIDDLLRPESGCFIEAENARGGR